MKTKRFKKFKKPCTRFSTRKKWIVYVTSYLLQTAAFLKVLFTGKEVNYAFYFSKKQNDISFDYNAPCCYPTYKGKEYSECSALENGWNNWNDSKLVGIGSDSDITFNNNEITL